MPMIKAAKDSKWRHGHQLCERTPMEQEQEITNGTLNLRASVQRKEQWGEPLIGTHVIGWCRRAFCLVN